MHKDRTDGIAAPSRAVRAFDRRGFMKGGLALGAFALTAPLAGCSLLGIENPNEDAAEEEPAADPGSVDFDGLLVTADLDQTTWSWLQINNPSSSNHGSIVVGVPITATNNSGSSRVLNSMYCRVLGPDGSAQSDISAYYTSDDILQRGSIYAGSTESGVIHILYRGEGTYTLSFDNLLGRKASLPIDLPSSASTDLRPIPPGSLNASNAAEAVPYGTPFAVGDLTLTLTSDESSYLWVQSWDETNLAWNGRQCVGVGLTIANNGSTEAALTADMYGLYAPALYRLEDPAPWFADTAAAYSGAVAPGQTIQTYLYWAWVDSGLYYAVFDNAGQKAVVSANIAVYY